MTICNEDLESYQLSFDIAAGDPFTVNGEIAAGSYMLDQLDNSIETFFVIENSFGCLTELSVGPINCECRNDAGTVINDPFSLCIDELLDPNISNGDYILEQGDSLMYVIHDGIATVVGNILASSFGEDILFDDVFMANTVYYLTTVIGEFISGNIDLNDPCVKYSESVPVEWLDGTDIVFVGMLEACLGDIADAEIQVSGNLPIQITQGHIQVIEALNSFSIYDRWGNLVFVEVGVDGMQELPRWDGTFNGLPAEQGVYVFLIDATLTNGKTEIYAGDITLVR